MMAMRTTTGTTLAREIEELTTITESGDLRSVGDIATSTREKADSRKAIVDHLISSLSSWTGEGAGRLIVGAVGMWSAVFTPSAVLLECPPLEREAYIQPALLNAARSAIRTVSAAAEPHAESVNWLREATGLPLERIGRMVGVSRMTLNNWSRGGEIADDNRRRLLAVRQIVELAARRHQGSSRLAAWLDTPRGASGRTPFDLLVAGEFDQARYLAASEPSPNLVRAPSWAYRPLRRDEEARGEHVGEALPAVDEAEPSEAGDDREDDEWETVQDR